MPQMGSVCSSLTAFPFEVSSFASANQTSQSWSPMILPRDLASIAAGAGACALRLHFALSGGSVRSSLVSFGAGTSLVQIREFDLQ